MTPTVFILTSRRRAIPIYTQRMPIVRYGVGDIDEVLKVYNVCVCVWFFVCLFVI